VKKIAIIGPESTGKSTLCEQLAAYYKTQWVPEYAREHLVKYGMKYSYDDLLTIAHQQVALEEKYLSGAGPNQRTLFIDTEMYVMKVWCEFVFGQCHSWILEQIAQRKYDLYLLCNIDLPWSLDPLREYPDIKPRQELYHIYKDIMINQAVSWRDISGNYDDRLQKAIASVDELLKQ